VLKTFGWYLRREPDCLSVAGVRLGMDGVLGGPGSVGRRSVSDIIDSVYQQQAASALPASCQSRTSHYPALPPTKPTAAAAAAAAAADDDENDVNRLNLLHHHHHQVVHGQSE